MIHGVVRGRRYTVGPNPSIPGEQSVLLTKIIIIHATEVAN
jgi:hypothetical protein